MMTLHMETNENWIMTGRYTLLRIQCSKVVVRPRGRRFGT